MLSLQDRFLCPVELLEIFLMGDMWSRRRLPSDRTSIGWPRHEGHGRCMYFKMEKSWLREDGFKPGVVRSTLSGQGSATVRLTSKAEGLWSHFMGLKKPIWEEQFKRKNKEVSRIKELNDVEDTRTLLEEEMRGRQGKTEIAVKEVTKLEIGRPHV